MAKPVEQRLKDQLGEQLFALAVLQTELEKAQEKLAVYEKAEKKKPKDKEESNVTELKTKQ